MKNVVDISCFSSGKRLGMRVFDGLRGGVRLAGQIVDSYTYGQETCAYSDATDKSRIVRANTTKNKVENTAKIDVLC